MKQEDSAAEQPEVAIILGDSSSSSSSLPPHSQVHISKQKPHLCLFLALKPNKAFIILGL